MTTLTELLATANRSEIARRMTLSGVLVSRDRVSRFAQGSAIPDAREIVALAPLLRLEIDELTEIVAAGIQVRESQGDSSTATVI